MATVFIGIGSNLGDRLQNCETAVERLIQDGFAKKTVKSKWYETEALPPFAPPFSKGGQGGIFYPPFINGVVKIETELAPRELLVKLQKIEAGLGRIRTGKKWEPRTIDLDILFYDDLVIDEPGLKIPHPELHKRMFVLELLCDIEPNLLHPVLRKTISDIVRACREQRDCFSTSLEG